MRFQRGILPLLVVVALVMSPVLRVLAQGTVLADNGFRPQQHGFSFENYGNDNKPVNLTPTSMRELFGDRVCKAVKDSECVLTASAQAWMEKVNKDMGGGHCEGMAALSKLIFEGKVSLQSLDPNARTIADLKADNPRVQAEIAKWFATQYVPPTATSEIRDQTPSQIVDTLINSLKPGSAPFSMGIYQADGSGGHAIKPYSVVDMGNGIVRIMVYDNNYPNQERFIEVDRNSNTWKYTGTTNPDEPVSEYSGDASSFSLTLTPTTARLQLPQECDFCNKTPAEIAGGEQQQPSATQESSAEQPSEDGDNTCQTTTINTGGNTDVVVTTADGKKAGVVKGQAFSQIDGVVILRPRSSGGLADDTPGALIIMPKQQENVRIDVKGQDEDGEVYVNDCDRYQKVSGIGQDKDTTLLYDPEQNGVTVQSDDELDIEGGYNNDDGNDMIYRLENVSAENGGTVRVGIDPETGELTFGGSDDTKFNASLFGISPDGDLLEKDLGERSVTGGQGISFNANDALEADGDVDFDTFDLDDDFFSDFDGQEALDFDALFDELDADDDGMLDEAGDDEAGDDEAGDGEENKSGQ